MMRYYGGYGYPMMGFNPGGIIMGILCILLIIVAVFVIVRLVRHQHFYSEHKTGAAPENSALKILNERYAKGEISDEEYKAKKANLQ